MKNISTSRSGQSPTHVKRAKEQVAVADQSQVASALSAQKQIARSGQRAGLGRNDHLTAQRVVSPQRQDRSAGQAGGATNRQRAILGDGTHCLSLKGAGHTKPVKDQHSASLSLQPVTSDRA